MENIKNSAKNSLSSARNTLASTRNNLESARNSIKETAEKFSKIPIGNIVNNNEFSFDNSNDERMNLIKKILFWIFVILILAFLGFNIFKYLAEGTDIITALLSPFTHAIALLTGDTAKTTIENTSQGSQKIVTESSNFFQIIIKLFADIFNNSVEFISNTSTSGIDFLQSNIKKDKITNHKGSKRKETEEIQETEEIEEEESILDEERKIENRIEDVPIDIEKLIIKKEENEPEPSESDSQQHGYCYIGKVNNSRYCAKVSSKNKCMSGDIFPTMDICINPNLRS